MGTFLYFHPESASIRRPKLNQQEGKKPSKHTITISYVFRIGHCTIDAFLFSKSNVTTGETKACFYALKDISAHGFHSKDPEGISVRACPLASLQQMFPEHFTALKQEQGRAILDQWHQARKSCFVGNVLEEAPKHGRWIWRN